MQNDPYYDEDSVQDVPSDIDSHLIMADQEPPILKSLKHIGKSFRQGGFCVAEKKSKVAAQKVRKAPTPTVSNDTDLASPLIVPDSKTKTVEAETVPKKPSDTESSTDSNMNQGQLFIDSPFSVLIIGILFCIHYPWGKYIRSDVEHLLFLFLFGFVVNYSLRSKHCRDVKEIGSSGSKGDSNTSSYSTNLRISEKRMKVVVEFVWVGLICTLIAMGFIDKFTD